MATMYWIHECLVSRMSWEEVDGRQVMLAELSELPDGDSGDVVMVGDRDEQIPVGSELRNGVGFFVDAMRSGAELVVVVKTETGSRYPKVAFVDVLDSLASQK